MKSKGFTLVELLGVVTILAMLGLVIVPTISNVLNDNKKKLYDVQIRNIKESASGFMADHIFSIDIDLNEKVGITLGNLKRLGYIDSDVTDPITKRKFSDDLLIIITKTDNGFEYSICESCNIDIPVYGDDCAEIFC